MAPFKSDEDAMQDIDAYKRRDMTTDHLIRFDAAKAKRLGAAYKAALASGAEQFSFEGADFLTSYAKYVLEYLSTKGIYKDGDG
jgi:hypothetical protein